MKTVYALIDADGYASNNKSCVYSTHRTTDAARKRARNWNKGKHHVQIIKGALIKGATVYMDSVGSVYPRVSV